MRSRSRVGEVQLVRGIQLNSPPGLLTSHSLTPLLFVAGQRPPCGNQGGYQKRLPRLDRNGTWSAACRSLLRSAGGRWVFFADET